MRKALITSVVVLLVALAAYLLLGGEVDQPTIDQPAAGTPSSSSSDGRKMADLDDRARSALGATVTERAAQLDDQTPDGGSTGATDSSEAAAAVKTFTDAAVKSRLAQNAERAKQEVERFCERNEKLKKKPVFDEKPPTRDAAIFLSSRVDWEGSAESPPRYGSLHLPDTVRPKTMGNFLTELSDADLQGYDFGWMKQLLVFDVWTFGGDGAAEDLRTSAMSTPIPNFVSLMTWSKLRFARALRDSDWNDAILEVRHLAFLIHTMRLAVADAVAVNLLKSELRAREQAAALNVNLASWPPPLDPQLLDLQRESAVKSGWFVAPGVDAETRKRALECSALQCTTVIEGLSLHSSLRTWSEPGEYEGFVESTKAFQCESSLVNRVLRMPPATLDELHWMLEMEDGPLLSTPDGG